MTHIWWEATARAKIHYRSSSALYSPGQNSLALQPASPPLNNARDKMIAGRRDMGDNVWINGAARTGEVRMGHN